jgi:hypothetical protein
MNIEKMADELSQHRIAEGGMPQEDIEALDSLLDAVLASGSVSSQLSLLVEHSNYDALLRPILLAIEVGAREEPLFDKLVEGMAKAPSSIDVSEMLI